MAENQNAALKENISHVFNNRPYSFHHTVLAKEAELALHLHWHEEMEFLYMEKGEVIFIVEDTQYHLHEGEAIFIPPRLLHMARRVNHEACSYYALVFNPILLTEPFSNLLFNRFIQVLNHNSRSYVVKFDHNVLWQSKTIELLAEIFKHIHENINDWELLFHGTLFCIWHLLYSNYISMVNVPSDYYRLSSKLSESIDWIHLYYANEITLRELASKSNISIGTFCRCFKKLTGFTPFSYLNRYRIIKSCEQLIQTNKKVADIATLCGFNNISYFNREFLKYTNTTPSAYRKHNIPTI